MTDSMTPSIEMTEHGAYAECDFTPMIDRIAEQVQWRVDHAALEQVAGELEKHGYVKVVRCRDCVHCYEDRRNTAIGWVDRFVCDSKQWSTSSLMPSHTIEINGFCAWGERRGEKES